MSRYVKRARSEPTSEEFIALVILIGPLAWPVRWAWLKIRVPRGSPASSG